MLAKWPIVRRARYAKVYISLQRCRKMSFLEGDVHGWLGRAAKRGFDNKKAPNTGSFLNLNGGGGGIRTLVTLYRPNGQLSVKCESQYTRGIAKCKQKSWHFLKRSAALGVAVGFEVPKKRLPTSVVDQLNCSKGVFISDLAMNLKIFGWCCGPLVCILRPQPCAR